MTEEVHFGDEIFVDVIKLQKPERERDDPTLWSFGRHNLVYLAGRYKEDGIFGKRVGGEIDQVCSCPLLYPNYRVVVVPMGCIDSPVCLIVDLLHPLDVEGAGSWSYRKGGSHVKVQGKNKATGSARPF